MTGRTEFYLDVDRGAIVQTPVGSTYIGDQVVWAMCRTGDGWNKRALKMVNLLNADAAHGECAPEKKD